MPVLLIAALEHLMMVSLGASVDFLEAPLAEVETLGFRLLDDFLPKVGLHHGVDTEEIGVVFRGELLDERKKSVDDVQIFPRHLDCHALFVLHKDVHSALLWHRRLYRSENDIPSHSSLHFFEQRWSA